VSLKEAGTYASLEWWKSLEDPQLNKVIETVLRENQDLKMTETGRRGRMGGMGGRRAYSHSPSSPRFALPRDGAMLRCQINRLNKTDVKEPYTSVYCKQVRFFSQGHPSMSSDFVQILNISSSYNHHFPV
jgi:hypothetical protein